jgi:hypothetical protein
VAEGRGVILHSPLFRGVAEGRGMSSSFPFYTRMAEGRGVRLHSPLYRGVAEGRGVILILLMSHRWGYCVCTPSEAECPPSEAERPPSEAEVGWLYTQDSRLGFARRTVCEPIVHRAKPSAPRAKPRWGTYTHKTLVSASLDEQFQPRSVHRAKPRSVPRAEPRGTYTHKILVSASLDEQLERSGRTHPALRAPLSMRGMMLK